MIKNLFYFHHINAIGGVETFFYYLGKKYSDKDIVVYYTTGDDAQIKRLSEYVRVRQYKGEHIRCQKAFFTYYVGDVMDKVDADEYIQVVHGDYRALRVAPRITEKFTQYLGVSKYVSEVYTELTGKQVDVAYNPIDIDKPKKLLHLISATRLTYEKGKQRILQMAQALESAGVNYEWQIFSNDGSLDGNPNFIIRKPRLDIINYIADADYLVQLSDTEGYGYSVVESLSIKPYGTPVIVTDCPVYKELGIQDGVHGFVVDFDMKNLPIKQILKGVKKFSYNAPQDCWGDILAEGESEYKKDLATMVMIRCTKPFYDLQLGKNISVGDEYMVNKVRAEFLTGKKHAEYV